MLDIAIDAVCAVDGYHRSEKLQQAYDLLMVERERLNFKGR